MSAIAQRTDWWVDKGFDAEPVRCVARGDEIVYRVFGRIGFGRDEGSQPLAPGHPEAWFTPHRPGTVREAVLLTATVEYGNLNMMLEAWRLQEGAICWVGPIRRDGFLEPPPRLRPVMFGGRLWSGATQVYVERPFAHVTRAGSTNPLHPDVFVHPTAASPDRFDKDKRIFH